jgi:HlyD family secretion protein
MKYVAIVVVVAAVLAGGLFLYARDKAAANVQAPITTDKVVRRDIEKSVPATGKVASNRDVDIKCQASGKVIKLPYDVSNRVKQGDLLMELDRTDQQRTLDQAVAQVNASKARVAQAQVNFQVATLNLPTTTNRVNAELDSAKAKAAEAVAKAQRTADLVKNKLASAEDLETDQTAAAEAQANAATAQVAVDELDQQKLMLDAKQQDIETAKAQLAQDVAKCDLSQRQLDYCSVFVPDDEDSKTADYRVAAIGTTTSPVQLGTVVQSGSSGFSGGTTVMTLSDMSHIFVLANVDESDIGQVTDPARGGAPQKAVITVDAYPNVDFEGQVVRVATKGVNTSNVVTFEVKIEVTSENRQLLRPEMTANVKIIVAARPQAISIPMAAFSRNKPDADTQPTDSMASDVPATAPAGDASTEPSTQPRRGRGRGGRNGGSGGGGGGGQMGLRLAGTPMSGYVQVSHETGAPETRAITVGLSDDTYYEVINGLEEGESVVMSRNGGDSKWRGQNTAQQMMRMGSGGGGRGR